MSSTETPAVDVRGHADECADGDDAGAADAGDGDVVRSAGIRKHRVGQRREGVVVGAYRLPLRRPPPRW